MAKTLVKTRFAPSPTGYIHLGNARTALFNALYAWSQGGIFLLRVEDTDRARSKDEFRSALEQDLRWLALQWGEGPGAEADNGPYLQSQRVALYDENFGRLEQAGLAYPCFCTPEQLEHSRKAQLRAGRAPRYAGTCRELTPEQVQARHNERPAPSLRFRVPQAGAVVFEDLIRGPQSFESSDIGDFIVRRADGSAAFFFCNAVDDALMGVTHVLRGEDHLANTPRQIILLEALGLREPSYGHFPMIVGDDGAPLSKRHGSFAIQSLREQGYRSEAIINYLARLGHAGAGTGGLLDIAVLARSFDLQRISRSPSRFDGAQLMHWQHESVRGLSDDALWSWLSDDEALCSLVPAGRGEGFAGAVKDNIERPADALLWARRLFAESEQMEQAAGEAIERAGADFFAAALSCLDAGSNDFRAFSRQVGNATGSRGRGLFMPLRAALTGQTHGPEMARVFPLLGAERIHNRLDCAHRLCADRSLPLA
jgi:glutamyl-tRNA synthetase